MTQQVVQVGPVELTWQPDRRLATMRFVEEGIGGKVEAQTLSAQLTAWAGEPGERYRLLVDCSEIVDVDAGWRAVWAKHFRADRDVARVAWFNANARVRLIILMFRKGTQVEGRAFATEQEAEEWLVTAGAAP